MRFQLDAHPGSGWDVHFGDVPITYALVFDTGDISDWIAEMLQHIVGTVVGTDDEETIMTLIDDRMQGFFDPDAQLWPE